MKESSVEFYINNFNFVNNIDEVDLGFIPPLIRRRLNKLDKVTLSTLNSVYSDNIDNIVFSSHFGECERLIKIIGQYKELKEVSPNTFSGSVHNYPVGFFLLNKKKPISYNALSFEENDISSGLLASIISNYNNIIYSYSDILDEKYISLGLNFSKIPSKGKQKFRLALNKTNSDEPGFNDYTAFFEGKKDFLLTPLFTIERVKDD